MPPPPTQLPPQLKWHNTLPAHFSENQAPRSLVTPGRRAEKRQQPSPDAASLRAWNEGGELHPSMEATGSVPSPTKRHRTIGRASGSNMTTPTKANSGNNGSGSFSSAGSGMQTPPPSGSSMSKRRGRPPKAIPSFESPRATASPAVSPSKGPRYIKSSTTMEPVKLQGSPLRPSASSSKDVLSSELYDAKSSILDADTSIDWPSFDDEGFPTTTMGSDIFLHSEMGYGDLADPMAFSFNCPNDFDNDSLPSIDPNLIFSSRPTSDASSIFGGYTDDTDVLSSSSIANEQPYQHQYDYSRRERALELQRAQRRKEKAMRKYLGDSFADPRLSATADSSLRRSFSDNILQPSSSFRAASLDEAVSRQGSVTRGRENTTPPASVRHLQPKTEVKLLISPSGRAKTETKVVYDDSDTEPDEATTSGNSLDESMESDSSMDEATPRGLGPGGKPYSAIRKAKSAGPFPHRGPKLGLFSTTPYTGSSADPGWSVLEDPSSPARTVTEPVERPATRAGGVSHTPRRYPGRSLDECILSSPKLPTPLRSTPGGIHSRPSILSPVSYHGSLRMDSRLQPQTVLDISDESEAETVVDENVDPDPEPEEPRLLEEDQEGNALQALRHAVAKRRAAIPDMTVIRSPARARPGSSLKRVFRAEQAGVIPPSIAKSLFALPPNLAPPVPAPIPQRKTLRRRRVIPDGGYSHPMEKSGSFSTISDPDFHASSTEEEGSLESDENIRCICGADRDGGTLMVQCDSCNSWLHLKCTGLDRKALPETYNCSFCSRRNQRVVKPGPVRMGGSSFRGTPAPTVPGSPIRRQMC